MTGIGPSREAISNLQALRGFAALAVTFYHTAYVVPALGHTEFSGVCVFFVISGFIMTYITRERTAGFLWARVSRIVPLYWFATIGMILWDHLGLMNSIYTLPVWAGNPLDIPRLIGGQLWAMAKDGDLQVRLVKSLLFIPCGGPDWSLPPLLGVGWSLNLEMFFYVLFAVALRISRIWAPALVCLVLLALKLPHGGPLLAFYAHSYTNYFVGGVAVFYVWRLLPVKAIATHRAAVAFLAAVIAVCYLAANTAGFRAFFGRAGLWMPALIVLAGLALHSAKIRCYWRPAILLGDASYALYLTHPIVMETLRPFGDKWRLLSFHASLVGMAVALALCCGVAIGIHRWVERPTLRWLRGVTGRYRYWSKASTPSGAARPAL